MDEYIGRKEAVKLAREHAANHLEIAVDYMRSLLEINVNTQADAKQLAEAWSRGLEFLIKQAAEIRVAS